MAKKHEQPMQPLYVDAEGITRFQENGIVRWLLDWATPRGMGLNELAMMRFSAEDHMQVAQLIGYSLSGYGELNYVTNKSHEAACNAEAKLRRWKRAPTKTRTATKRRRR